jgi:beta-xylosidase
LWKSSDLKKWEPLGLVWDLKNPEEHSKAGAASHDMKYFDVAAGVVDSPLVFGLTAPEIHFLKKTFWITYSFNGQGTGLLKSRSGNAEGPYEDVGMITRRGGDASLFEDNDGAVYWVFGEGWIAKMNEQMTALTERPRLLQPAPNRGELNDSPLTVGSGGAFLFKANGKYFLAAADVWGRLGNGCYDTFVAQADSVYGPYSARRLMIPHGGQVTVFQGPDGALYSTFSGIDRKAALRDRPAIVPLEWATEVLYGGKVSAFPRKMPQVITERGPWAELKPAVDVAMRDVQVLNAPDGFYYLTGSVVDKRFAGKPGLWRSRDLNDWEKVEMEWNVEGVPGLSNEEFQRRSESGTVIWGCEIHYINGTFYFLGRSGGDNKLRDTSATFMLRSISGKAEGPYEFAAPLRAVPTLFTDDDGTVYHLYGRGDQLQKMKPDMSGYEGQPVRLEITTGAPFCKGDVGSTVVKMLGKYVIFATTWNGAHIGSHQIEHRENDSTYDFAYYQADKATGPYTLCITSLPVPHGGHGTVFPGKDGKWYAVFFGNDSTSPWWTKPGILPLEVQLRDGQIDIQVPDKLPDNLRRTEK